MIKKLMMILGTLTLVTGLVYTPVMAQDTEEETTEEKVVTIPDMLSEVEYVTKVKPKKKASVYYFLRSHSNCGYCVIISGSNNAAYKEMKGKGAELIMLNCDPNTEKAKAWADKSELNFPIVTPETKNKVKVSAEGFRGYPHVVAVTADGTLLKHGGGANEVKELLSDWKSLVKESRKIEREKRKEAEAKKKAAKKKAKKQKAKPADAEASEEDTDLEL